MPISNPNTVIERLRAYEAAHSTERYYEVRAMEIDAGSDCDVAAWLIYLNKTCFNGIYRVNKAGRFNVPIGDYKHPVICDEPNLRRCAEALQHVVILAGDFAETLETAGEGDFVYLDPPYLPTGGEAKFTSYTRAGFGLADHERLRDLALALKRRGCRIVLHNSDVELARKLYDHSEFTVTATSRSGSISAKTTKRGRVGEILVT